MNVIFIPSWYPTPDHPITGIFVRDQAMAIAKHGDEINIGISLWGSHSDGLLLSPRRPFQLLRNLSGFSHTSPYQKSIATNCSEYFQPALTWSRKYKKGNIEAIIEANLTNVSRFEQEHGPIDLIHGHMGHPGGYIAAEISNKLQVPLVITEQMSPFPSPFYLTRTGQLDRWISKGYKKADINIAVGSEQLSTMRSFGIERLKFIPNLVDESFFTPAKDHKNVHNNFVFFALGRLEEQKGFDILIRAFKKVLEKHPNTRLRIGGDGSEKERLNRISEDLNLQSHISWLGMTNREESLREFLGCDAFVLSSRHESFGIVLAEALACGKPIVTTLCGGPEDIFTEQVGLSVKPENTDDLALKMIQMIQNHSSYDPKGIRKYFEANFSSKVVAEKIIEVYEHVLKKD